MSSGRLTTRLVNSVETSAARRLIRSCRIGARRLLDTAEGLTHLPELFRSSMTLPKSPAYMIYLCRQLAKSRRYASKTSTRSERLIHALVMSLRSISFRIDGRRNVLCVGCRNAHELTLFRRVGFTNVIGVDLFSSDERIMKMDMHALQFPDNSFDIIYSCHSLEHSIAPQTAAKEFIRVAKPGAVCVIEVPVKFQVSHIDLQDYGSTEGVQKLFEPNVGPLLFASEANEADGGHVARLAFSVIKDQ